TRRPDKCRSRVYPRRRLEASGLREAWLRRPPPPRTATVAGGTAPGSIVVRSSRFSLPVSSQTTDCWNCKRCRTLRAQRIIRCRRSRNSRPMHLSTCTGSYIVSRYIYLSISPFVDDAVHDENIV